MDVHLIFALLLAPYWSEVVFFTKTAGNDIDESEKVAVIETNNPMAIKW